MLPSNQEVRDILIQNKFLDILQNVLETKEISESQQFARVYISFCNLFLEVKPYMGFKNCINFYLLAYRMIMQIDPTTELNKESTYMLADCLKILKTTLKIASSYEGYRMLNDMVDLLPRLKSFLTERNVKHSEFIIGLVIEVVGYFLSLSGENSEIEGILEHSGIIAAVRPFLRHSDLLIKEEALFVYLNYCITDCHDNAMELA